MPNEDPKTQDTCDICGAPALKGATLCPAHHLSHYGGHRPYQPTTAAGIRGSAIHRNKGGVK